MFLNFQTKSNCQFVHNCLQCIQRSKLTRINSFKNYKCSTTFWLLVENLLTSCWKSSAQLSKLYFRVQSTFGGKFFSWKLRKSFCLFCILIDLDSCLCEFYRQVSKTAVYGLRRSIRGKTFGVIFFFILFQIWGKNFRTLATTVWQRCQKCTFCASRTSWGKFVSKKCIRP